MRIFVYAIYVSSVFAAFGAIVALQAAREVGIEKQVYVQFDDTNAPELFGISGVYHGCQFARTTETGSILYVGIPEHCPEIERKEKNPEYPARTFVYCWEVEGWVFISQSTTTPCEPGTYLIRSFSEDPIDANSFDLLTSSKASWILSRNDDVGGEALITAFFLESTQSFEDRFVYCGANGVMPIRLQKLFNPLPEEPLYYPTFGDQGTSYRKAFGLSYRPVYTREIPRYQNLYQVLIFNGLRWEWLLLNPRAFAQNISKEEECPDEEHEPECWRVFIKYFPSTLSWRFNITVTIPSAISDPMPFLSPFDRRVIVVRDEPS